MEAEKQNTKFLWVNQMWNDMPFSWNFISNRKSKVYAVVIPAPEAFAKADLPDFAFYHNGWNGSLHDCQYSHPRLVVAGKNHKRCRERLDEVFSLIPSETDNDETHYDSNEDSSLVKLKSKYLRTSGD